MRRPVDLVDALELALAAAKRGDREEVFSALSHAMSFAAHERSRAPLAPKRVPLVGHLGAAEAEAPPADRA